MSTKRGIQQLAAALKYKTWQAGDREEYREMRQLSEENVGGDVASFGRHKKAIREVIINHRKYKFKERNRTVDDAPARGCDRLFDLFL